MKPASRTSLYAAAAEAEAILCDWDGCLALHNCLLPGAADFLRSIRRFAIVSNNSTLTQNGYRVMLQAQGVSIDERHIHLAGDTMLRVARPVVGDQSVLLIASPAMRVEAERLGYRLVTHDAACVMVMRDPYADFALLERAANDVARGAMFWSANGDGSHPVEGGIAMETGALVSAIAFCAGRSPDRVFGKPETMLFDRALTAMAVPAARALMIGDNPATDLAGAKKVGIRALMVDNRTWDIAHVAV